MKRRKFNKSVLKSIGVAIVGIPVVGKLLKEPPEWVKQYGYVKTKAVSGTKITFTDQPVLGDVIYMGDKKYMVSIGETVEETAKNLAKVINSDFDGLVEVNGNTLEFRPCKPPTFSVDPETVSHPKANDWV